MFRRLVFKDAVKYYYKGILTFFIWLLYIAGTYYISRHEPIKNDGLADIAVKTTIITIMHAFGALIQGLVIKENGFKYALLSLLPSLFYWGWFFGYSGEFIFLGVYFAFCCNILPVCAGYWAGRGLRFVINKIRGRYNEYG